jgi:hypothetical protein
MTYTPIAPNRALLDTLRRRRGRLRESMTALESALARPASGDLMSWAVRVHVALVDLSADLRMHEDLTEGDDGLYAALHEVAPWLVDRVDALAGDQQRIRAVLHDLLLLIGGPYPMTDVETIRPHAVALLGDLARHRQRAADLVYEGLGVDIGQS